MLNQAVLRKIYLDLCRYYKIATGVIQTYVSETPSMQVNTNYSV